MCLGVSLLPAALIKTSPSLITSQENVSPPCSDIQVSKSSLGHGGPFESFEMFDSVITGEKQWLPATGA